MLSLTSSLGAIHRRPSAGLARRCFVQYCRASDLEPPSTSSLELETRLSRTCWPGDREFDLRLLRRRVSEFRELRRSVGAAREPAFELIPVGRRRCPSATVSPVPSQRSTRRRQRANTAEVTRHRTRCFGRQRYLFPSAADSRHKFCTVGRGPPQVTAN